MRTAYLLLTIITLLFSMKLVAQADRLTFDRRVGLGVIKGNNKRVVFQRQPPIRNEIKNLDFFSEIDKINLLTQGNFSATEPLLILHYNDTRNAIHERDKILKSLQWYTNYYETYSKNVELKLGNILIVSSQQNPSNNDMKGIFFDNQQYFKNKYKLEDDPVSFIWLSNQITITENSRYVINYMETYSVERFMLNKQLKTSFVVQINPNGTLNKSYIDSNKPNHFSKYVVINDSLITHQFIPILQKKKLSKNIKSLFNKYLSEISKKLISEDDTLLIHFKKFRGKKRNDIYFRKVKKMERKTNRLSNVKFFVISEIGSSETSKFIYYDYLNRLRKNLFEYEYSSGSIAILYPDGNVLIKYNDEDPTVALKILYQNEEFTNVNKQFILEMKNIIPPLLNFDPKLFAKKN